MSGDDARCGLVYVATDPSYLEEALRSRRSARLRMPELPAALFAPAELHSPEFETCLPLEGEARGYSVKFEALLRAPYPRSLFVDTDTYFCAPVPELFALLDRFDLAAAHAPGRFIGERREAPESFTEFNSGVIAFRRSPLMEAVWRDAAASYREAKARGDWTDQPHITAALYRSGARIATLPPEYNCRTEYPGTVNGLVKVIHGRHPSHEAVDRELNASSGSRSFYPWHGYFRVSGRPFNCRAALLQGKPGWVLRAERLLLRLRPCR